MHKDEMERLARMPEYYCSKHEAERWWRAKGADYGGYICNGALLMAAIQIGMIVRRIGSSPNTHFPSLGIARASGIQPNIAPSNASVTGTPIARKGPTASEGPL
jgi:hypothetical protein